MNKRVFSNVSLSDYLWDFSGVTPIGSKYSFCPATLHRLRASNSTFKVL